MVRKLTQILIMTQTYKFPPQFNWWDFALEDFFIENAAECRSDLLGNVQKWREENWILNKIESDTVPLFELCGTSDDIQGWKFMSCCCCQELWQQSSWLLTGYTRVNNQ